MRLVVGSDHAGFALKGAVLRHLAERGHIIEDAGSFNDRPVDFPDIAQAVTGRILSGSADETMQNRGRLVRSG